MFFVPAFSLLSAIGRDRFAVSSRLCGTSAGPELPLPASGLSFEQKRRKTTRICQASQNEHLQKSSCNSREMTTYEIAELKSFRMNTCIKSDPGGHRGERRPRRNVYQQDELRGVNKVGRERRTIMVGRIGVAAIIPLHSHSCATYNEELQRNQTLTKKWGVGPRCSDPFGIARDRAMINVP